MNEKVKELINFLSSLGFKGENLEKEIDKKFDLNLPVFVVKDKKMYGEEQMQFDLHLRKDFQFETYRLDKYKAIHRLPVIIEHKSINGMDTSNLEEQIKSVDWNIYFSNPHSFSKEDQQKINTILSDLGRLDAEYNFDGRDIQQKLQFKYWPETVFAPDVKELEGLYVRSREFTSSEYGICNANLAYHIVSGRFDDLFEKMSHLGLETFPRIEVYPKLEEVLSAHPDQFEFKCSRNEPEGFIEYVIPISKIDGWYSIDKYKATLTPYPPIEHGIYNEIDTQALEDKMRQIDWHNDHELFIFHEDWEPEFKPKVNDVQEQIYRLSLDTVGADIADKLQLKYWSDASFFEDNLQQSAWDYLDSLPKREQHFPVELEAKAAFNLLCGRATLQNRVYPFPHEKPAWVRFNFTTIGRDGGYLNEVTPDFTQVQLENILSSFPISSNTHHRIIQALNRGDITPLVLSNNKKIFIEANPEQKTVNIYSEDMRPIQVNLHFDPNWKSIENKELNSEEPKWKPRKNIVRSDDSVNKKSPFRRRR